MIHIRNRERAKRLFNSSAGAALEQDVQAEKNAAKTFIPGGQYHVVLTCILFRLPYLSLVFVLTLICRINSKPCCTDSRAKGSVTRTDC